MADGGQRRRPVAPLPRAARADADVVLRTARSCWLVVRLVRSELLRVDLREGLPAGASSSAAPPRRPARRLRVVRRAALRSVALTPGFDVSTTRSRRRRLGRFGFGGFAARCCCFRNACALVAMSRA